MMETTSAFQDFIDGIHSSYIGFGGGIIVLLIFLIINRAYFSLGIMLLCIFVIYPLSLFTGIALKGYVDDRISAFVAGLWAPIIYCTFATILIRYSHYKSNKNDKTNYDHLID